MTRSAPVTLSVTGRLLRTRGVAVAFALAFAAALFGVSAVRVAAHMRAIPLPDVVWDGGRVAGSVRPDVQPGDELVAVAGVRADPERLRVLLTEVPTDETTTLVFDRAGTEVAVPVDTAPLPEIHVAALWLRVICALLCLALGLVSFILAPGSRTAWLFLVFCVALEVLLVFNVALARFFHAYARVHVISFATSASIGLHLFFELPRRIPLVARRAWAALLPYVPAVPLVACAVVLPHPGLGAAWYATGTAAEVWSVVSGVCTLTILVLGLRRAAGDEPLRSRYATLILGVAVGLFVPGLVHTARQLLGVGLDKWVIHVNAAPVVVYAAATGYALLRQNVLGADRVTAQVVSYAATLLVTGAACGIVLIGVPVVVHGSMARSPLALVATTAIASLSVVPLYRRLKRAVDRRFLRDKVSDERIATELRDLMRVAMLGDPARTLSGAFRALDVLKPEKLELWLREGKAFHRRRGEGEPPAPIRVDGPLGEAIAAEKVGGVDGLASAALSPEAQAELWDRGLALAAPVLIHAEPRAFVALGRQAAGARYRMGDESFLAMVAVQIGLALERGEDGTSVGKYRLERRLGMGGMAEVYLARQIGLGGFERRVALKRPLPHLAEDPAFLSMFIDEAKLAAQLHHPNIVQTYEVDRVDGSYLIAMEYVDGASLRSLLRAQRGSGTAPPLGVSLAIIDALLGALAYAHGATDGRQRGLALVHRDISPGNVLVGAHGEVKLTDFGVARSATRLTVTQTGVIKGTLAYMAPEQAAGRAVDVRSDVFGVGAVLHELCLAQPPYPDGPPAEPRRIVVGAELPAAVAALIERALAWDPDDRFATAAEMQAALRAIGVSRASEDELAAWALELRTRPPDVEPEVHEADTQRVIPTRV
jgi:serine/threonine-protein kinase